MDVGSVPEEAHRLGREVNDSAAFRHIARFGLVSYGFVHLVLAWLILQIAFRDRDNSASTTGAVHQVAEQPLGRVLLWAVAAGLLALVAWRGLEALVGHRDEDGLWLVWNRARSAGKAVVYGAIAWTALSVAAGAGSGGGQNTDGYTARVLSWPAGQLLVALVGAAIIGVAAGLVKKGVTDGYQSELDSAGSNGSRGGVLAALARTGHVTKGVAFAVVGGLFVWAAVTHEAQKSGGLDQALSRLVQAPAGPVLLSLVAFGFACYGAFCLGWARHLDA